ncbi:MAG: bifunctional hydroxymethylpyrimidine kinase/phosphomethylpyrimidine kinase [Gammaproteobacteria bacterium]|nr:bifunctional hydroxymethylpyrimidine kinase/phosphomethylpyrimidine kinase [Gammaproteobacteria bacterium]
MRTTPVVLFIGGHDPTGGAGIQADIESAGQLGARAVSLVTALTAQDTQNVAAKWPTPVDALLRQFDTLVADIRPDVVKIGMLGEPTQATALAGRLTRLGCPLVLDPVLAAGGGFDLGGDGLIDSIRTHLLPLTTLLTPNRNEARRLAGDTDADRAAGSLLAAGAGAVLLTGADEADGQQVLNRLYRSSTAPLECAWPRLPYHYHGSGCTLASACATLLAHGLALEQAVTRAQETTWTTLDRAEAVGHGQWLPRRRP